MQTKKVDEYYVGFDIGTNSVGYAVTDKNYNLIKHGGEPMWGSHVFEAASTAQERRTFRTARRRNDRKKQRIKISIKGLELDKEKRETKELIEKYGVSSTEE